MVGGGTTLARDVKTPLDELPTAPDPVIPRPLPVLLQQHQELAHHDVDATKCPRLTAPSSEHKLARDLPRQRDEV